MPPILLFTGLSGSGKSTLAEAVKKKLEISGHTTSIIDGDVYRNSVSKDLGFSEADRKENMRRLMAVAVEKQQQGHIAVIAAINPFEDQRMKLCKEKGALVVYIECPLPVLIERDTKGLYKRALLPHHYPDKLNNLTGVNDRYDVPTQPDLTIHTAVSTLEDAVRHLYEFITNRLA